MANGQDTLDLSGTEPITREEEPLQQQDFDLSGTTEELDLSNTLPAVQDQQERQEPSGDLGLPFMESVGFDLANMSNLMKGLPPIGKPQTRAGNAGNAFIRRSADLFEGIVKAAGGTSDKIARNIVKGAPEGSLPFGLSKEQILSEIDAKDNPIYEAGKEIGETLNQAFPESPEFQGEWLSSILPGAAGNLVSIVGTGALTGGVGSLASSGIGFSGLEYGEALEATGDEEIAFNTFLMNIPVNSLEGLPVLAGMRKFDGLTGKGVTKLLKKLATTRTGVGLGEGTQEIAQEFSQNLIAKNMYDETRDLTSGLKEGGGAGFIMGFALRSMGLDMRRRVMDPNLDNNERAEAQNTLDFIEAEQNRLPEDIKRLVGRVNFRMQEYNEGSEFSLQLLDTEGAATKAGSVRGKVDRGNERTEYQILFSDIEPELQGLGFGTEMYLRLLRAAKNENALVYSDISISPQAMRVYEALERRGIKVEPASEYGEGFVIDASKIDDSILPPEVTTETDVRGKSGEILDTSTLESIPEAGDIDLSRDPKTGQFKSVPQKLKDVSPKQSTMSADQPPKFFEKWLAPHGFFRKNIREFLRNIKSISGKEIKEMSFISKDLNTALKKEYNVRGDAFFSKKIPQKIQDDMNAVLTGEKEITVLPENLREPIVEMRNHIDRLSRTFLDLGIVEGDLAVTFKENIGLYIHRTYKVHNNPKWKDIVEQDVINRAKATIREQYSKADIKLNDQQIDRMINFLLDGKNKPISHLRSGKGIGGINTSPLMKRKEIPEAIRALLGEETNALTNYAKSIVAMSNYIDAHQTLAGLRDTFKGIYFFDNPVNDPDAPVDAVKLIAKDKTGSLGPLAGLYTFEDIQVALEDNFFQRQAMSRSHRLFLQANAGAKFAKTVLNPVTIGRNVTGGAFFTLSTGIVPTLADYKQSFKIAKTALTKGGTKELRAEVLELLDLNLLGTSALTGEINDYIKDLEKVNNVESMYESMFGGRTFLGRGKKAVGTASQFYQAGDDLNKIAMYHATLRKYKEANPNITEREVARIVNDTYQNYDEAGHSKFVQGARRNILVAPFIAFQYEVLRTTMNNYKLMRREVSHENPKMRRIGYRRLVGMSTFTGLGGTALAMASKALLGISDDEDDDVRRFAAPWDARSTLVYLGIDKRKGRAKFFNLSYIDPYENLKDPIVNLLVNDNEEEFLPRVVNSLKKSLEPIIGTELFAQKALEWQANKTQQGGEVYNPQADLVQKTVNTIDHFWDVFKPGFLDYAGNVKEAATDFDSPKTIPGQVGSLFGFRPVTVDFRKSLSFKARDFSRASRDSKRIYNSAKFDDSASIIGKERAYIEGNKSYQDNFIEFSKEVEAAYRMGVSWREIENSLKDNGVSSGEFRKLKLRLFKPFDR